MSQGPADFGEGLKRNARRIEFKLLKTFGHEHFRGDTLEGLCEYWLPAEPQEAIEQGLEHLVQCGLVRRFGQGREALYMAADPRLIDTIVETITDKGASDDEKQEDV